MRREDAPRVHQVIQEENIRKGWLRKPEGSWL